MGLFLPDWHDSQQSDLGVGGLLNKWPDLINWMPLDEQAMSNLQSVHDNVKANGNAKATMIAWGREECEGLIMFKVGDKVVYPQYGVAEVKRIQTKVVGGKNKSFYVLEFIWNKMILFVSVDDHDLRPVMPKDDVEMIYSILRDRKAQVDLSTWNKRYREYMEKISTGKVTEIAEVLRNLTILRAAKDLSFGERKMLDRGIGLLVQEISLATSSTEKTIEEQIQTILAS